MYLWRWLLQWCTTGGVLCICGPAAQGGLFNRTRYQYLTIGEPRVWRHYTGTVRLPGPICCLWPWGPPKDPPKMRLFNRTRYHLKPVPNESTHAQHYGMGHDRHFSCCKGSDRRPQMAPQNAFIQPNEIPLKTSAIWQFTCHMLRNGPWQTKFLLQRVRQTPLKSCFIRLKAPPIGI